MNVGTELGSTKKVMMLKCVRNAGKMEITENNIAEMILAFVIGYFGAMFAAFSVYGIYLLIKSF